MLDLCLALSVPSVRHLESMLTRGEIDRWFAKMRLDQFSQHGQDVRRSVEQARLFSALAGLGGRRRSFHPRKFMLRFDAPREDTHEQLKRKCMAIAHAFGGTVKRAGGKVS